MISNIVSFRRAGTAALVALIGVLVIGGQPAGADESCADHASVEWEIEPESDTPLEVIGAVVDIEGCPDGTEVGMEVETDDGESTDTIVATIEDGEAHFDLTDHDLLIPDVVGVSVMIYGESDPDPDPDPDPEPEPDPDPDPEPEVPDPETPDPGETPDPETPEGPGIEAPDPVDRPESGGTPAPRDTGGSGTGPLPVTGSAINWGLITAAVTAILTGWGVRVFQTRRTASER